MGLLIACSKGCGGNIEVTDEMLDEAKNAGRAITVAHDVCPTEAGAPQRKFKVQFVVSEYEDDDTEDNPDNNWAVVASIGAELEAGSFKVAVPELARLLNEQWSRVLGMADFIDQPTPDEEADDTKPE